MYIIRYQILKISSEKSMHASKSAFQNKLFADVSDIHIFMFIEPDLYYGFCPIRRHFSVLVAVTYLAVFYTKTSCLTNAPINSKLQHPSRAEHGYWFPPPRRIWLSNVPPNGSIVVISLVTLYIMMPFLPGLSSYKNTTSILDLVKMTRNWINYRIGY